MIASIKTKAFTLIELLVVVAIISMLSSVVIVSVSEAREKAAISKIIQQIRQVQNAIEMYRTDYGNYPADNNGYPVNIESMVQTNLTEYIKNIDLSTQNINSFEIVDGEFLYKNNLENPEDLAFSCEGYGPNVPYIIYFATDASGLNYPNLELFDRLGGESLGTSLDAYCVSSQI